MINDEELALISQNRRLKARPLTLSLSNTASLALEAYQAKTKKTHNTIVEEALKAYLDPKPVPPITPEQYAWLCCLIEGIWDKRYDDDYWDINVKNLPKKTSPQSRNIATWIAGVLSIR